VIPSSALVNAVAAGDPDANRVVYGAIMALVVIGVLLVGIGVWLFRQTRVDPELLAPLERMADRSWSRRDPATQRRMLDDVRPTDSVPLHREPKEPTPDEDFDQTDRPVESFDDLKAPAGGDRPDAARREQDDTTTIDDDEAIDPDHPVEENGATVDVQPDGGSATADSGDSIADEPVDAESLADEAREDAQVGE
jgi:hypothetical protein